MQALGEDWEMPSRMMELQEALENYTAVMLRLWPLDDTPHNIRRTLLYNNYAGQSGEDEKGRIRYERSELDINKQYRLGSRDTGPREYNFNSSVTD